jgi:hypothetical protein
VGGELQPDRCCQQKRHKTITCVIKRKEIKMTKFFKKSLLFTSLCLSLILSSPINAASSEPKAGAGTGVQDTALSKKQLKALKHIFKLSHCKKADLPAFRKSQDETQALTSQEYASYMRFMRYDAKIHELLKLLPQNTTLQFPPTLPAEKTE